MFRAGQQAEIATRLVASPPPAHQGMQAISRPGQQWSGASNVPRNDWQAGDGLQVVVARDQPLDLSRQSKRPWTHPREDRVAVVPPVVPMPIAASARAAGAPTKEQVRVHNFLNRVRALCAKPSDMVLHLRKYDDDRKAGKDVGTFPLYCFRNNISLKGMGSFISSFRPEALGRTRRDAQQATAWQVVKEHYLLGSGAPSAVEFARTLKLSDKTVREVDDLSARIDAPRGAGARSRRPLPETVRNPGIPGR